MEVSHLGYMIMGTSRITVASTPVAKRPFPRERGPEGALVRIPGVPFKFTLRNTFVRLFFAESREQSHREAARPESNEYEEEISEPRGFDSDPPRSVPISVVVPNFAASSWHMHVHLSDLCILVSSPPFEGLLNAGKTGPTGPVPEPKKMRKAGYANHQSNIVPDSSQHWTSRWRRRGRGQDLGEKLRVGLRALLKSIVNVVDKPSGKHTLRVMAGAAFPAIARRELLRSISQVAWRSPSEQEWDGIYVLLLSDKGDILRVKGDADVVEGTKFDTVALPHFMPAMTLLVTVTSRDLSPAPRCRVGQSPGPTVPLSAKTYPKICFTMNAPLPVVADLVMKWSNDGTVEIRGGAHALACPANSTVIGPDGQEGRPLLSPYRISGHLLWLVLPNLPAYAGVGEKGQQAPSVHRCKNRRLATKAALAGDRDTATCAQSWVRWAKECGAGHPGAMFLYSVTFWVSVTPRYEHPALRMLLEVSENESVRARTCLDREECLETSMSSLSPAGGGSRSRTRGAIAKPNSAHELPNPVAMAWRGKGSPPTTSSTGMCLGGVIQNLVDRTPQGCTVMPQPMRPQNVPNATDKHRQYPPNVLMSSSSGPILKLPPPDSNEEFKLFRALCLELLSYCKEVRRAIITQENHPQAVMLVLSLFRCPFDLSEATLNLTSLAARMVYKFNEWRASWIVEDDSGMPGEPIECLKRQAFKNLAAASTIQVDWLDIFIRIFGDLPELWNPVPSSTYPPTGTSNPGFPENGNDMHTSTSNTGSFQTPQTLPSSMLDLPGSNGLGVGSTGPSSMCPGGVGSPQPCLRQLISDPTPVGYQGHALPSQPIPHQSLPESASGVYHGGIGGWHSLPNLSSGVVIQGMPTGWLDGSSSDSGTLQEPAPVLSNSVPSNVPPVFPSVPVVSHMAAAGHSVRRQAGDGASHRSSTPEPEQPRVSWIGDAVALENAKATAFAGRNSLSEHSQILLTFFHDPLHRLLLANLPRDYTSTGPLCSPATGCSTYMSIDGLPLHGVEAGYGDLRGLRIGHSRRL
ncbi:hypothetical protein V8D89_013833 [Ganoderma adspersum]